MKPLLKWAGGKRWLLPVLREVWPSYSNLKLIEPFTGGMAVALGLNPASAMLNDANAHLINFYKQVSRGLEVTQPLVNQEEFYYLMRAKFNELIASKKHATKEAAILFYFLIRTGFNGLCRFNSNGEFNVPFGRHTTINYKTNFLEYKSILNNWQLQHGDFTKLKLAGDEFIYVDPPYDVQFTRYNAQDFTWDDQARLVQWLLKHDGPIIASNQATSRIKELYLDHKFRVYLLPAPRKISCNGDRAAAIEILAVKNVTRGVTAKLQRSLTAL